MNDLTRINGIGPATARALAVAGIESITALAAADAAALAAHEAFRGLRAGPGDLAGWIAQAREAAGTAPPPDMNTEGGKDSARAVAADSAEPPLQSPEPTRGRTGAGKADEDLPPAPAPAFTPPAPDLAGFVLIVTGPKRGRRRAGMGFDATPRRIEADQLTPDQMAALRDDPALTVEIEERAPDN